MAMALSLAGSSRANPPFTRTPLRAADASPATMLTGVEITSAQGQPMTSRTSAWYSHAPQCWWNTSGGMAATRTATAKTTGV